MVIAVAALIMAFMCFLLLAYVIVATDKVDLGIFGVRAGRNEVTGTGVAVLLAGMFAFFLTSILTWPEAKSEPAIADTSVAAASSPATPPEEQSSGSTASTPQEPEAGSEEAMDFLVRYLQAAPTMTKESVDDWFTFPLDFYKDRDLTDRDRLVKHLTPNPDPAERTSYEPPTLITFDSRGDVDRLFVNVQYMNAQGVRGSVDVRYTLARSDVGEPYRIRSIAEV